MLPVPVGLTSSAPKSGVGEGNRTPDNQIHSLVRAPVTCARCGRCDEDAGELQIVALAHGGEGYLCEDCQTPWRVKACAHCGRLAVPDALAYIEDALPGYHTCQDCEYGPYSVALAARARVIAFQAKYEEPSDA